MGELKMTLHPYSDTMVSLLWFPSLQFCLVINTGWFKWSLVRLLPPCAHWQSFEQSPQNESEPGVKINRNHIITGKPKNRTMSKPFFLICHTMLDTVFNKKLSRLYWDIFRFDPVNSVSLPISNSILETIFNKKLWTLQSDMISRWMWSTACW